MTQLPEEQTALACPVPDQAHGAPPGQTMIMLAFRFLLELIAFGTIGWAGWRIGDGGITGGVFAAIALLIAAAVWGTFSVPDDPTRKPTPVVAVPGWLRLGIEFLIFGLAAWSLWVLVSRAASETFLTALGIATLVGWDRTWWIVRHR